MPAGLPRGRRYRRLPPPSTSENHGSCTFPTLQPDHVADRFSRRLRPRSARAGAEMLPACSTMECRPGSTSASATTRALLRRGALYESYEDDGVFDVAAEVQHERVVDVAREIVRFWGNLPRRARPRRAAPRRNLWQTKALPRRPRWHRCLLRSLRSPGSSRRRVNDMSSSCKDPPPSARSRGVFRAERLSLVTVGTLSAAPTGARRRSSRPPQRRGALQNRTDRLIDKLVPEAPRGFLGDGVTKVQEAHGAKRSALLRRGGGGAPDER
jgi:hypothetical protein